jgi:tetratricopeptide (TPR) repeat protein
MVKDAPFLGHGLACFATLYPKYKLFFTEESRTLHNNYLQLWAEGGAVILIIYLLFCGNFLIWGYRKIKNSNLTEKQHALFFGCYIGGIGFLIHSFVDFDFEVGGVMITFWTLLGIMFILTREGAKRTVIKINQKIYPGLLLIFFILFILTANRLGNIVNARIHYHRGDNLLLELEKVKKGPLNKKSKEFKKDIYISFYKKIISEWERALILDNKRAEYHLALGKLYLYLAQIRLDSFKAEDFINKAVKQYRLAIRCNPRMPYFHNSLGWIYYNLWRRKRERRFLYSALEEMRKAISFYPTKGKYILNIAVVYKLEKEYRLFNEYLKKAISLLENQVKYSYAPKLDHYFSLGQAYEMKGDKAKAIEAYKQALKNFSSCSFARRKIYSLSH